MILRLEPFTFYVVNNLIADAFLGGDFGDTYKSILDRATRKISYLKDNKIRIAHDTIIPPKIDQAIEIQPIQTLKNKVYTDNILCAPFKLCRQVVEPKIDKPILFVSNLSDKPIEIKKGVVLGHWEDISNVDQVIEMNSDNQVNKQLTRYQRRKFDRLISKHSKKLFSNNPIKYDPNKEPVVEHEINLKEDAVPERSKPYTVPYNMKPIQDKEIKDQLENNIIRNSKSSWSSPIVMVLKPDGSYRFCVNLFQK